jgi:hypothetical protein
VQGQLVNLFWAVAIEFGVSRVGLLVFAKLGDNAGRMLMVHAISYALAGSFFCVAHVDGRPDYVRSFTLYAIPTLLWLMVDLARMAHRRRTSPHGV